MNWENTNIDPLKDIANLKDNLKTKVGYNYSYLMSKECFLHIKAKYPHFNDEGVFTVIDDSLT